MLYWLIPTSIYNKGSWSIFYGQCLGFELVLQLFGASSSGDQQVGISPTQQDWKVCNWCCTRKSMYESLPLILENFGELGPKILGFFYTPPQKNNNNIKLQNDCLVDGFPLQRGGFQDSMFTFGNMGPWILQPAVRPGFSRTATPQMVRANTPDAKQLSSVWPNEVLTGLFVEDEDLVKLAVVINFSTTGCLNDTR